MPDPIDGIDDLVLLFGPGESADLLDEMWFAYGYSRDDSHNPSEIKVTSALADDLLAVRESQRWTPPPDPLPDLDFRGVPVTIDETAITPVFVD